MLNKCCFIGNLGSDPDVRKTQAGKEIVNLSLAVTERWKDSSGERKERTEWVRVVIFNDGLAGVAKRFLRKGSKAYVEGQLQTRKWTDQSGQDRYSPEIVLQGFGCSLVLLDGKGDNDDRQARQEPSRQQPTATPDAALDDDIPW